MSNEFLKFVREVAPKALGYPGSLIKFPAQPVEELYKAFLAKGAEPQDYNWVPVSKTTAEKVFGDLAEIGNYYLTVNLDGDEYQFSLQADGAKIYYVLI